MGAYEYRTPLLVWQDSPNPALPYADWATAAHTIQDAVDAAVAGDEIVVTNGIYVTGGRATIGDSTTNRVAVDRSLSVRSVNGSQSTTIDGGGSIRCVNLINGATLSGFTVTNGSAHYGGGVWCESTGAVVSNCVLAGNSAGYGGGAFGGMLNYCTLNGNAADGSAPRSGYFGQGGGASFCTLNNCTLTNNFARIAGGAADICTLNNCALIANSALGDGDRQGGAGGGASGCTLNNCTLTYNFAGGRTGQGGGASGSILNNCTLTYNDADVASPFSLGGGAFGCILNNCTLTDNGAGARGGGASGGTLNNCIVYFNYGPYSNYDYSSILNYCCTTPNPGGGIGNITNSPLFVDLASGNLRLQSNSPCINAGLNSLAPAGPDLDGNPRIKAGTVDMGAYEFQAPVSMISYAWLQQYGLPTDGSADVGDPDGDGMTNWQEWRCGTDPRNAQSALRLLAPTPVGAGLVVRWESVADRTYFLERSTTASSGFTPVATGIPGRPGMTTYTDTNAIGKGPWFYRVGVGAP